MGSPPPTNRKDFTPGEGHLQATPGFQEPPSFFRVEGRLCSAPPIQEDMLGATEGRQLSCRCSGGVLDASRCLPVHLEDRLGHRLRSCPGKAGKEQEELIITISVITVLMERLAHDIITGAEPPSAPAPSGVTPPDPPYGAER